MRKIVIFIFGFLFLVSWLHGQIISQYIETNSGSTPKGIEIWNNTVSALDFSTNNLVIEKGTNGGTPSADYTLSSGTLASEAVIVIGTSDMETTATGNGALFYEETFTFNGNDALVVKYGETTTDVFGTPESDPGTAWTGNGVSTANQNIRLKAGINTGDTDGWTDPSIRFEIVNTDPSGTNGDEGFGIAPILGGNIPPSISNVIQTPGSDITSSTTVSVSADVTDSDGTITNVELHWGTDSGSLGTTINMSLDTGDTYVTDTDIPAQSDGVTVYYEIEATDDEPDTSTSTEFNYTVFDAKTTTLPYNETFDADLGECYVYNLSGPTKYWYQTSDYAYMNGYDSGDTEEDWLILPGINLDNYSNEIMTFDTRYQYGSDDANNYLKLMYSTDYTGIGDVSGASWTELSYTQPATATTWETSGNVDLSAISGTSVRIAFKYRYESGSYRLWEVDNISIAEVNNLAPVISNILKTPSFNIGTSTTVSISADVTDSDGTITNVELHWGTDSGSLGNTISMSIDTGNTYLSDSNIPAQSEGTTVYYEVYAVDDGTASTTSDEYNYYVSDAADPSVGDLIINEICGDGADVTNDDDGFVEIYNSSGSIVLLENVQVRYYNSNPGAPSTTYGLSGVVLADEYIVITQDNAAFTSQYGFAADFEAGGDFYFNGGDDGVDIYSTAGREGVLDSFNDNGSEASPWTWNDNNVFERLPDTDGALETSWTENTEGMGTPGAQNPDPPSGATQLAITGINDDFYPTVDVPFYIVVQSQDDSDTPTNVTAETQFSLSVNTGTGSLGGTITGSIAAGSNETTVTGITYDTVETDVSLTATRTAGDELSPGNSSAFEVLPAADHLVFLDVPDSGYVSEDIVQFQVRAARPNGYADITYTEDIVITVNSGSGNMTGTTTRTPINGVCWFNDIQFDAADTYTLSATSGSLTSAVSDNIIIVYGQLTIPENVIIVKDNGNIDISWDSVPGATNYNIYSDTDPYGTFDTLEANTASTSWSETLPAGTKKFYKVTAQ